ncbi:unnamed protein product [Adineta steineri]|uniref:Uncharacterized protein n=1 Tax=Adineta steineri TaxID=433720 RepID=A0A814Q695_9BILA|nr:unnamed protein product [Adineta steineri]CAF1297024.1 unnamed protein product [Adineta steineri]
MHLLIEVESGILLFIHKTFVNINELLTCPHDHDWNINKCQWQDLYWPNAVHLSLSIQQASDLFLLHHRALPILDHLCVTIFNPVKCFTKVIENDLELKNTTNMMIFRLRSLQLSHISLAQLLIYLSSIHMPLLEKLTLIDVYDNTLNHLNQFQQYFQSKTNMPALQPSSFKFLLRFPGEFEYEWKRNRNYEWPFETTNIDYCLEEYRLSFFQYWRARLEPPIPKYSLLIFTISALSYRRTVHNHSFAMKLKQTSQASSILWTCNQIDNSQQIFDSLVKLKTTKTLAIIDWKGTRSQNVR